VSPSNDEAIRSYTDALWKEAARLKVANKATRWALDSLDYLYSELVLDEKVSPYEFEQAVTYLREIPGFTKEIDELVEDLRAEFSKNADRAAQAFWQDLCLQWQDLLEDETTPGELIQNISYYWANDFVDNNIRYYGLRALKHLLEHERKAGNLDHLDTADYRKLLGNLKKGIYKSKK